ncbi:MAG: hypothetical protein H6725_20410 [Sandaracinaceae bacterium]|nr:hypothetical protein [Sandaracinaceae bacterium]
MNNDIIRFPTTNDGASHGLLDDVRRRLDVVDPSDVQSLRVAVSELARGHLLRALLVALVADERELTLIAGRSYLHGNGFHKLELLRHAGFKVRLHVWQLGTPAEENIHDHRWAFASHVLVGELRSEVFVDDTHGEVACAEHCYVSRTADTAPSQCRVGRARLRCTERNVRRAGTTYSMTPDLLHRIEHTGHRFVSTLMVSAPPLGGQSRLLIEEGRKVDPDVAALPLTLTEARTCLIENLQHMNRGDNTWVS